jgi:hypothetical protein
MNAVKHPRLANWLLRRFGGGPRRESLIGDLDEQFARGRSSFWYWRQVLSAILVGVSRDLSEHKLLAVRSAAVTCGIVFAWHGTTLALYLWISRRWVNAWVTSSSGFLFWNWHIFGGHLHLLWCVGAGLAGWMTVRLHRTHPAVAIVAGVLGQLPMVLWWAMPIWIHPAGGPPSWHFAHRLIVVVMIVGMPMSTLLGGLLGARGERGHGQIGLRRV